MPHALLLDLDDTILQYDVIAEQCWQAACEECLPPAWKARVPDVLAAIRRYRDWYWSDPERARRGRADLTKARLEVVAAGLQGLKLDEKIARELAAGYRKVRTDRIAPFPGALEALDALRRLVPKLALITNGESAGQRAKIERFDLAKYFDCICIEGEFGAGKPENCVYEHVLAVLGSKPNEAWMVGDNLECDVAAPQRLGISAVWVDVHGRGLSSTSPVRPDAIVRGLHEIVGRLRS